MIKFFTASWCTACQNLKNNLQEGDLDLVTIIDADSQPNEVQAAGVRSIPTLIKYDEEGEEVNRHSGTMSRSQFLSFIE